jgi:hypothetical protein
MACSGRRDTGRRSGRVAAKGLSGQRTVAEQVVHLANARAEPLHFNRLNQT